MTKTISDLSPKKILIRSTNWIGDAIMTTPAVRTIRENFPAAEITILAYPWVADIFKGCPHVDRVMLYEKKGRHKGLAGMWRLGRELAAQRFDMAILLQNAFSAALLALLAGIPVRAGYRRDGRGLLLTHGVSIRKSTRERHQVYYYQEMLKDLGLMCGPQELFLALPDAANNWARDFLAAKAKRVVVGLNPGAAYGPAKRWPAERYAGLAKRLAEELGATLLVFGTEADGEAAAEISAAAPGQVHDLTGKTSLAQAMALIGLCDAFVTNDSGLMHVAAAQKTPLVAIFGSTDAVATGPFAPKVEVVNKHLPCSPCMKTHCPQNDFACMLEIGVDEVYAATYKLLVSED
ncbi:lipopolysaccharide heptosyltransferase II [Thiovibrio frasassiensis]|jgi:heptosyltransferase-2|uniref:lipopolysaccharide heptosyltransferase II n=1 Tax=Thiovibrio frasassiensis TaxID=2984131 RepID=A0A9X4RM96_9BACT|nr:lipopolysaccharide heptosyltransferase II [Thiovibrio frasassiensis]MDG4476871.1 lipopolysaccharide heptosyltransferase II [Thiovibrio frasassiensis]